MNTIDDVGARTVRREASPVRRCCPEQECVRLDWDGVAGQRCIRVTVVHLGPPGEKSRDEQRERLMGTVTEPMC